jgi:hypothetical protein
MDHPPGIDLTEFAPNIDNALADGVPMLIATCEQGQPDLAFKGSLMVWDRDHLAYWERSQMGILAGLRANERVAVMYRHPQRGAVRFFGSAHLVESGELRDQIWQRVVPAEQARDPERTGLAVLVRVDTVKRGRDVIQQRDAGG